MSAVLEIGSQLQQKSYWREEAKALEHQGRVKGFETSKDQILGEHRYADADTQITYNEHILSLCPTTGLNVWDKIQEPGKGTESYTKVHSSKDCLFWKD